jgi:hypothetical protein
MRFWVLRPAGALVACALTAGGCSGEEHRPARTALVGVTDPNDLAAASARARRPTAPPASPSPVTHLAPDQPVPPLGSAPPAAAAAPATPGHPAANTAPPAYGIHGGGTYSAYGATEAQPRPSAAGDAVERERARVAQLVGEATFQIDRLQRIQSMSTDANRGRLDGALDKLEHARERVLQGLRTLEAEPAEQRDATYAQIEIDLSDLRAALDVSLAIAPPPGQGLPPPSPPPP